MTEVASAQEINVIPFQGHLSDQSGRSLTPTVPATIVFRLYNTPVGGVAIWEEAQSNISVNAGRLSVLLGSRVQLPSHTNFNATLYLGLTIDDTDPDTTDVEMRPRQALVPVISSSYAKEAAKLNGFDWSALFGVNDPRGDISGRRIAAESISADRIESRAITADRIAPFTLTSNQIAPGTITGAQVAAGTLDLEQLAMRVVEALNPPGTVVSYAGDIVPPGWLLCDGAALKGSDYPALYAAIKVAWGAGYTNGVRVGDFNLPDLRGMFLRGVSGVSTNDPDRNARFESNVGGNIRNTVGSVQPDEIARHAHDYTHQNIGGSPPPTSSVEGGNGYPRTTVRRVTDATGGNESRPRNVYVNFIIKY